MEKAHNDIGTDLETLDIRLQSVQGKLGDTIKIGNVEVPNINAGMGVLMEKILTNENAINRLADAVTETIDGVVHEAKVFESIQQNRWLSLAPLVQQIKSVIKSNINHPLKSIVSRLNNLETKP